MDFLFFFLSQFSNVEILYLLDIIGLNKGVENWEAVLNIHTIVQLVGVNTNNFNFISRLGTIDVVSQQNNVLVSRDSTWQDTAWRFLDSYLLEISVDSLLTVNLEWTSELANLTLAELQTLLSVVLVNGSHSVTASTAEVEDFLQLGIHWVPSGDDSLHLEKGIQMVSSELSQIFFHWELSDFDENLLMDVLITWEQFTGDIESHLVHKWENKSRVLE